MTILVWDGVNLGADCQIQDSGHKTIGHKIFRLNDGNLAGWVGAQTTGLALVDWWAQGADPEAFPEITEEFYAVLVIVQVPKKKSQTLKVFDFDSYPQPTPILSVPAFWGSGRAYAAGAMYAGADIISAIHAAEFYDVGCGSGYEILSTKGPEYDVSNIAKATLPNLSIPDFLRQSQRG